MPARDLVADLAKAICERIPDQLSTSAIPFAEEYISKDLSPGLDPEVHTDDRLERILKLYIENLKIRIPQLLEVVIDKEVQVRCEPPQEIVKGGEKEDDQIPQEKEEGDRQEEEKEDDKTESISDPDVTEENIHSSVSEKGGTPGPQTIQNNGGTRKNIPKLGIPLGSLVPLPPLGRFGHPSPELRPVASSLLTGVRRGGNLEEPSDVTQPRNNRPTPKSKKRKPKGDSTPGDPETINEPSGPGVSRSNDLLNLRPRSKPASDPIPSISLDSGSDPSTKVSGKLPKNAVESSPEDQSSQLPAQRTEPTEPPKREPSLSRPNSEREESVESLNGSTKPNNIQADDVPSLPNTGSAVEAKASGNKDGLAQNIVTQDTPKRNNIKDKATLPTPLPKAESPSQFKNTVTNNSNGEDVDTPEPTFENDEPKDQSELVDSEGTPIEGTSTKVDNTGGSGPLENLEAIPQIHGIADLGEHPPMGASPRGESNSQRGLGSREYEPLLSNSDPVVEVPRSGDINTLPINILPPTSGNGEVPTTPENTYQSLPGEQFELFSSTETPTLTPDMVSGKPGPGSSSSESEDEERDLDLGLNTHISGSQTPIPKPAITPITGLGLSSEDLAGCKTLPVPSEPYIVGPEQDPLSGPPDSLSFSTSPSYQDTQPSSPLSLDTAPIFIPRELEVAKPEIPVTDIILEGTVQQEQNDKAMAAPVDEERHPGGQVDYTANSEKPDIRTTNKPKGQDEAHIPIPESRTPGPLTTRTPDRETSGPETPGPKTSNFEQTKVLAATEIADEKIPVPVQVQGESLQTVQPISQTPQSQNPMQNTPTTPNSGEETPIVAVTSSYPEGVAEIDAERESPIPLTPQNERTVTITDRDEIPPEGVQTTKGSSSSLLNKFSLGNVLPQLNLSRVLPVSLPGSGTSTQGQEKRETNGKEVPESEGTIIEYHKDAHSTLPSIPCTFPSTEKLLDETNTSFYGEAVPDLSDLEGELSAGNSSNDIWGQVILWLVTITLEAWIPYFELIGYFFFPSKAVEGSHVGLPSFNTLILDSWTPGLELLDFILSLPHTLPEHFVPESKHFSQPSIELWIPVLETVEYLLAAPNSVPYHLVFSSSTYISLPSTILGLLSSIIDSRPSSLPPHFDTKLKGVIPSFQTTLSFKPHDEAPLAPSTDEIAHSVLRDEFYLSGPSLTPSPSSNTQSLHSTECARIPCYYSRLYLYFVLLTWVLGSTQPTNSANILTSIISCSIPILVPALLHFKFSLGFPLSLLHLFFSSSKLLRNVSV
ncbi:hypothetical protein TWF481_001142 [Arthrobotrys musiformis]|uniref:Uncharacterized protein n=1 Tax=Arthrobotrys musiformis TaxID=47236 RepID=A0AAV9WQS9_9PEZI